MSLFDFPLSPDEEYYHTDSNNSFVDIDISRIGSAISESTDYGTSTEESISGHFDSFQSSESGNLDPISPFTFATEDLTEVATPFYSHSVGIHNTLGLGVAESVDPMKLDKENNLDITFNDFSFEPEAMFIIPEDGERIDNLKDNLNMMKDLDHSRNGRTILKKRKRRREKKHQTLSTPPATPVLKSSFTLGKTKRSNLLIKNELGSDQSSMVRTDKNLDQYNLTIKFVSKRDIYNNYMTVNRPSAPMRLTNVSNTLVPLSAMKLNPRFRLSDAQVREHQKSSDNDIDSIKFNLNYVKTLSNSKEDRYYSRLNIFELSKILELDMYDISLTKEIEINILEIFKNYCNFKLGYQTWIRDTTKEQRENLINLLYSYTSHYYPEFNKFKLEVIVRRGSYSLMQSRLRKERRSNR
ncbi:uncharacterized protein PRCAT00000873001 [Priceomyces carsonii]|uniref:uncharacterized protein n=1 Tax=Priceomyces carsonii TaxID=28549 RepID=UPI002ED9F10E|nr:unnamed protein product [Priceomyces carsonii]